MAGNNPPPIATYLAATIDGFTKPDVLPVLGILVDIPVLSRNTGRVGIDASLTSGKVTVGSDGISRAALVRINPVEACHRGEKSNHSSLGQTFAFSLYSPA